jgi:hypothetical protein
MHIQAQRFQQLLYAGKFILLFLLKRYLTRIGKLCTAWRWVMQLCPAGAQYELRGKYK